MNNPKLKGKSNRDHYRFGSIAKREGVDCTQWESIYHTIGNFSLLPNYDKACKRHLQLKHNDVNERWDILLSFCRKEWKEFSCSRLNDQFNTFNEYMKYTIQEMYFEELAYLND